MTYSTFINGLKVLLPFVALAVLSTIFLLARSAPEQSQLPFLETSLDRAASNDAMRNSFYAGSSQAGDAILVKAKTMKPDVADPDRILAEDLRAEVDYTDGSTLALEATDAVFSELNETMDLSGDVFMVTSTGYTMRMDALRADLKNSFVESFSPVEADGPDITLSAGKMTLSRDETSNAGLQIEFTQGVSLMYQRTANTE